MYNDALIGTSWNDLGIIFECLFDEYPIWSSEKVFEELVNIISDYHKKHEIFIFETDHGVHYDIPLCL